MARVPRRLVSSALLSTLAYAAATGCGGESLRREDGGGTAASATGGGGANTGGTGLGGARGGSGGAAGVAGTPDIDGQPDDCFLEPDPGPCRGLMPRFAFDVTTTLCLPFTYGGCAGNENNFETAESCYATCDNAMADAADCESPDDCVLVSTSCCSCEVPTLGNTIAVNVDEVGEVYQAMNCELVDCPPCEPTVNRRLEATCTSGYCVAFETRESGR